MRSGSGSLFSVQIYSHSDSDSDSDSDSEKQNGCTQNLSVFTQVHAESECIHMQCCPPFLTHCTGAYVWVLVSSCTQTPMNTRISPSGIQYQCVLGHRLSFLRTVCSLSMYACVHIHIYMRNQEERQDAIYAHVCSFPMYVCMHTRIYIHA